MSTIDLRKTFLQLLDGPRVNTIDVGPTFWQTLGDRADLQEGRMVMALPYRESWGNWERHPNGDEVVLLIEGQIELIVETDQGEERTPMKAGDTVLVPQSKWHTADVSEPGLALHITRGEGTDHRPR